MSAAAAQSQPSKRQSLPGGAPGLWRVLIVGVAAVVLACQLLVPPIVGMADNGDFSKLVGQYGLTSPAYYEYVGIRYPFRANYNYDPGFRSSEQLFLRSAILLERVLGGDGSLDVRVVGIVHGALFLLALALFVPLLAGPRSVLKVVYCAAVLFVFMDVMYVSYLNSLYMDVSALLALMLATVFYLRAIRWRRRADAILFVASSLILISSKPQYAPSALWIAALLWIARGPLWGGRTLAALASAALILITGWATFRFAAPPGYSANNCFNMVFFQILPHARDANRTLSELGLDAGDRVWIGKTAYSPGSKMGDAAFSAAFSHKVSYVKLARFYLTHPRDTGRALRNGLAQAGRERERVGNWPVSAGKPPLAESRSFALWSDLKFRLFYGHPWHLLLSFLIMAALVLVFVVRQQPGPGIIAGVLVLIGTALTQMLIASLADALDLARHHLLFHAQFDILILAALWLGIRRIGAKGAAVP